jgi:hypothetical protein
MKAELEQKIVDIAPYLFRYEGWDNVQESCLIFGIECSDGWYDIIADLVLNISKVDLEKRIKVYQIKEKFGSLRFYTNCEYDDKITKLIVEAENKSAVTCEACGKPSKIRGATYHLSLCDECWKEVHDE